MRLFSSILTVLRRFVKYYIFLSPTVYHNLYLNAIQFS